MVSIFFFDILKLPHTVISNSEKLTHPNVQPAKTQSWVCWALVIFSTRQRYRDILLCPRVTALFLQLFYNIGIVAISREVRSPISISELGVRP